MCFSWICNWELLFIGKRKDEDDMANQQRLMKKEYVALEKKEQESIEATKTHSTAEGTGKEKVKAEESKNQTHRLCQIEERWNRFWLSD